MANRRVGGDDRPDAAAPLRWLAQLGRLKPAPIPWLTAARAALAMVVPFAVGLALGQTVYGLLASLGTIPATMADVGGPYRLRILRIAAALLAAVLGFLIGAAVRGEGWQTALVVTIVGGFAAAISAVGAIASSAALQLVVYAIVGSGRVFPGPIWLAPAVLAAGGGWALALTALEGLKRGDAPEREAVSRTYRAIAQQLAAVGSPGAQSARQELTAALDAAYDALFAARLHAAGSSPAARPLFVALIEATPLIEAANALLYTDHAVPPAAVAAVERLADSVADARPPPPPPRLGGDAYLDGLDAGLRAATRAFGADADPGQALADLSLPPLGQRLRAIWARVAFGTTTRLTVVRLMLCLGVAEVLTEVASINRSYWVALTVCVVIKPDFGSVFARAVQRALGTALGVLIGSAVLALVPTGAPLLPFMALFAGLLPIARVRNYGLFSAALTPLILILIDSLARDAHALVLARLADTALGCGIVLLLGYALWPETWRSRLPDRLAATIDEVAGYLVRAFEPGAQASRLRRQTYRRLADLRTALQQSMAEPPPAGVRAAALWPVAITLERVTDGVTAASVAQRHGGAAPPRARSKELAGELSDLAAALRARRAPAPRPAPSPDDPLADLAGEIGVVRSLLSGPKPRQETRGPLRLREVRG